MDSGHPDLMLQARTTKDPDEVEAIRRAARGTVAAMGRLRDFLASLRRDGEHFRADGAGPVKLGDLRRVLHREFLEHGLAEDQGDSIVSQGRDAGVPHNRGDDDEPLTAGRSLIVDIFPGEAGGGYHSDMTRTFCMGPAPAPLKRDLRPHARGLHAPRRPRSPPGKPCRSFQDVGLRHLRAPRARHAAHQRGHAGGLRAQPRPRRRPVGARPAAAGRRRPPTP